MKNSHEDTSYQRNNNGGCRSCKLIEHYASETVSLAEKICLRVTNICLHEYWLLNKMYGGRAQFNYIDLNKVITSSIICCTVHPDVRSLTRSNMKICFRPFLNNEILEHKLSGAKITKCGNSLSFFCDICMVPIDLTEKNDVVLKSQTLRMQRNCLIKVRFSWA